MRNGLNYRKIWGNHLRKPSRLSIQCGALALALSSTLLSGCSNYPRLVSMAAPPPASPSSTPELDAILAQGVNLQAEYERGYKRSGKFQDFSQIPIIGAAALAAWVLLVNKTNATENAAKIAIGAGSYAAVRGQFTSTGLTDAYINGHGALTCVLAESTLFSGTLAQNQYNALDSALQTLAEEQYSVEAITNQTPSGMSSTQSDLWKAALALADQMVAQGKAADTAARAQQAAYLGAAPIFRTSIAAISIRVASRGRVRPPVDFATLQGSLAPAKDATGVAQQAASTFDGQLISLNSAIARLNRATSTVLNNTRLYAPALTRVAACPEKVQ